MRKEEKQTQVMNHFGVVQEKLDVNDLDISVQNFGSNVKLGKNRSIGEFSVWFPWAQCNSVPTKLRMPENIWCPRFQPSRAMLRQI